MHTAEEIHILAVVAEQSDAPRFNTCAGCKMQVEPSRTELAINNPRVHSRDAIDEAVSGQPLEFRGRRETFKIGDREQA